uniref:Carbon dioxide concentrating mechanism protein CcmN n=1 Tax=Cyanothece sp. (strain PCC 7425 / ATCC 29141) TaxID=395961 RepID=B8HQJ4_CYAP4
MYLPSPQPLSHGPTSVIGDVQIHPNAVIAPGVLLYAEPDSQITIAAGVCIGMGSILHAHGGKVDVEAGANLGTGVLIVGTARIGSHACIGSTTTIINTDLPPAAVVAPGSLVGDPSRRPPELTETEALQEEQPTHLQPAQSQSDEPQTDQSPAAQEEQGDLQSASPAPVDHAAGTNSSPSPQAEQQTDAPPRSVYGQDYVNRMMQRMMPRTPSLTPSPTGQNGSVEGGTGS